MAMVDRGMEFLDYVALKRSGRLVEGGGVVGGKYREFVDGNLEITTERFGPDFGVKVEGGGRFGVLRVVETEIMVLVNGLKATYWRGSGDLLETRLSLIDILDAAKRRGFGLNSEAKKEMMAMDDLDGDYTMVLRLNAEVPVLTALKMDGDFEVENCEIETEFNPVGYVRGEYLMRWRCLTPFTNIELEMEVRDGFLAICLVNEWEERYTVLVRMHYDTSLLKGNGDIGMAEIKRMFAAAIADYEEVI